MDKLFREPCEAADYIRGQCPGVDEVYGIDAIKVAEAMRENERLREQCADLLADSNRHLAAYEDIRNKHTSPNGGSSFSHKEGGAGTLGGVLILESSQNTLHCEKWCGLPEGHTGECAATFTRDITTKASGGE